MDPVVVRWRHHTGPPPSGISSGEGTIDSIRDRHVFIETYGCRYNFGDTAKLIEVLKQKGNVIVESEDLADTIIINTCTVVGPTERRMLRRLSQFRIATSMLPGTSRRFV